MYFGLGFDLVRSFLASIWMKETNPVLIFKGLKELNALNQATIFFLGFNNTT